MCQVLEHHFRTSWNVMTSVNVAPIQFYDKRKWGAIKSHNLDIWVAVLFFYDWLFLQNNWILLPWSFVSMAIPAIPALYEYQQCSRGCRIQRPGTIKLDSRRIKMPSTKSQDANFFPVGQLKIVTKITLQKMWLEFLWCRDRLQWKSGMPRISVSDAEIKINEKGQKFLFV